MVETESPDELVSVVIPSYNHRRFLARTLDSVATGGFLGLWLGVYATSNGRQTDTVAHVEHVEYVPLLG